MSNHPRWLYKPKSAPWRNAGEVLRDIILEMGYGVLYTTRGFQVVTPYDNNMSPEANKARDDEIRDRITREYNRRLGHDTQKDKALKI